MPPKCFHIKVPSAGEGVDRSGIEKSVLNSRLKIV